MRLAAGRCSGYNKRRQENGGRKRFLPPSNFESEKSMTMSFTGFYPETIDFLWGIRLNNNREWFEAHKADYQRFLWEPMKALAADVEAAFTGVEGLRMRVSRIYRDMRMHPPVPYKETSWMCLRHDGASWLEHPCLFFELTSEGYSYGLLLWNPRAAAMERWRTQLGDRTEEFLQMAARAERETGLRLGGRAYIRPKQTPDERLAAYYSLRNVSMMRECPLGDELYTPRLAETVRDTLHALLPLYEFCLSAVG